jgi:hypothetical protein
VGDLSEKLKPVPFEGIRVDFDSFPEPEKQLFRRILEIQGKNGSEPSAEVVEANAEFIFKAREVIGWRVLELFMFVMKELLDDEIEEWYFKLHLGNFFADLNECLKRVRKWSDKDREEFLKDMKESGMLNKGFRFRRGPGVVDLKKRSNKQERKGDE